MKKHIIKLIGEARTDVESNTVQMALRDQIREFILGNFIVEKSGELVDSESMLNMGILDSTGILELVAFLESTYGIEVEDEELIRDNLDTIDNVVNYLERKLALASKRQEFKSSIASPA